MDFLVALIPSIGVILLFWLAIRSIIHADRRERAAQERIERAEIERERTETGDAPRPIPGEDA